MSLDRRHFLTGGAALLSAGCAARPESPLVPVAPISLVSAFSGYRLGTGRFQIPIVGVNRGLSAKLNGNLHNNMLTFSEDFLFDDGEKNRLTWRFKKTGAKTWSGRREDVIGEALVEESGTEIRLSYEADVVSKGSTSRLQFADVIYRLPNGRIINNAVFKKAGLPIGSIHLEFKSS